MNAEKEYQVVALMIKKYCKKNHSTAKGILCDDCKELLNYVQLRRSKCPFGDKKPFCSNCRIHCYNSVMREKIRSVMRFSGPRIVFEHPVLATRHLIESKREKKKIEREISR